MNDLLVHALLFLVVAAVIVVCGAFYSETEDAPAFRLMPKRLLWLVGGCALLALILIVLEKTVARVG